MEIGSVGSSGLDGSLWNQQTFGAQVVSETLDTMNNATGQAAPVDKQSFGAAVVSKTMDYMNSDPFKGSGSDMSQTYDFAKSVLSAPLQGARNMLDMYV